MGREEDEAANDRMRRSITRKIDQVYSKREAERAKAAKAEKFLRGEGKRDGKGKR